MYLADSITDIAEFPGPNGRFNVASNGRYEVFGDPLPGNTQPPTPETNNMSRMTSIPNSVPVGGSWGVPLPAWGGPPHGMSGPAHSGPSSSRGSRGGSFGFRSPASLTSPAGPALTQAFIKKNIPYVELCLDSSNRIKVRATKAQLFIKVPQATVSVQTLLDEAGRQLGMVSVGDDAGEPELCLLDNKFTKICDDIPKGINLNNFLNSSVYSCF